MRISIVLIIFFVLMLFDKGLTFAVLNQTAKNNPNVDSFSMEKNPLARFIFRKLGLIWGSILYGIISLGAMFLAFLTLRTILNEYVAMYIIILVFGLVIANNTFFLLKTLGVLS